MGEGYNDEKETVKKKKSWFRGVYILVGRVR